MLKNQIIQGDCIKVMKEEIPDQSINLCVSDPPYNLSGKDLAWEEKNYTKVNEEWDTFTPEEYKKFTNEWISEVHRVLKPNGSMYVCCSKHNLSTVLSAVENKRFILNNLITWYKNAVPSKHRRTFTHSCEYLVYAVKGPGYVFNYEELKQINSERQQNGDLKAMRDMWSIPFCAGHERIKDAEGKTVHSTQKPESLVRRCIIASSSPGDLVLDPFGGVATTAAVCKKTGRDFISIELDETYMKYSKERLDKINVELPKQASPEV